MLPITTKVKGFTLIEILIALFISGLIFTILVLGLKTMINNYQGLQKNQKQFKQLQLNLFQIQHDLEYVQPRKVIDETGKTLPIFLGRNDYMEFTTMNGKIIRQAYFYDKDKRTLISRTWSVLDRAKPLEYKDKILFNRVSEFSFQYFDDKKNISIVWPSNTQNTAPQTDGTHPPIPQAVKQQTDFPVAVIMTIKFDNLGKMTRFFLIRKSV